MREKLYTAGWVIDCESPLEIRHPDTESIATGIAADLVAATIESEAREDEEDDEMDSYKVIYFFPDDD